MTTQSVPTEYICLKSVSIQKKIVEYLDLNVDGKCHRFNEGLRQY